MSLSLSRDSWLIICKNNAWYFNSFPADAVSKIGELMHAGSTLRNVVFAPGGGWLILLENNAYSASSAFPGDVVSKMGELIHAGFTLKNVVFAPGGGWLILLEHNGWFYSGSFPGDVVSKIGELMHAGFTLKNVVFAPGGGWLIILEGNAYFASGFPGDVYAKLGDLVHGGCVLKDVTFAPGGGWLIICEDNAYFDAGSPDDLYNKVGELIQGGRVLQHVVYGPPRTLSLSASDTWYDWNTPFDLHVQLSYPAPAGGLTVTVASDNEAALPGGTIHVPAGATAGTTTLQSRFGSGTVRLSATAPDFTAATLDLVILSVTRTAPSTVRFPPVPGQWPLLSFPNARTYGPAPDRQCRVVELRGWLRSAASGDSGDLDWHFDLELDPAWADHLALGPNELRDLFRFGSMFTALFNPNGNQMGPMFSTSDRWVSAGVPCVHIELDCWEKLQGPPPADWVPRRLDHPDLRHFPNVSVGHWPFLPMRADPRTQAQDLAVGQYVRIAGSLILDNPHYGGDFDDVKKLWARGAAGDDPGNMANWPEIHSPDHMMTLPDKRQTARFFQVAVAAKNGLINGDRQSIDLDLAPPGPRPSPSSTVGVQEMVWADTNFHTITEGNAARNGAAITTFSDHVHVHVAVQGEGGWGAPGKFAALYRVFWT